jgi:hypothetical protein
MLLHDEEWLDFNMIQSSHMTFAHNYTMVYDDWHRQPIKPTLDTEPPYENIRHNLMSDTPVFTADEVRRHHYLGVFAGGLGTTYGCVDICTFWTPKYPKRPFSMSKIWTDSMDLPGAVQMKYLKKLISSKPLSNRVPDQCLLAGRPGYGYDITRCQALRDRNGSWAMIYFSSSRNAITVDLSLLQPGEKKITWFDPCTGEFAQGGTIPGDTIRLFTPPADCPSPDRVLILNN